MGPAAPHGFYICSGKSSRYLWSKLFLLAGRLGPFPAHAVPEGCRLQAPARLPQGAGDCGRGCGLEPRGLRGFWGACAPSLCLCHWVQTPGKQGPEPRPRLSLCFCRSFAVKGKRRAGLIFFPLLQTRMKYHCLFSSEHALAEIQSPLLRFRVRWALCFSASGVTESASTDFPSLRGRAQPRPSSPLSTPTCCHPPPRPAHEPSVLDAWEPSLEAGW